MAYVSTSPCRHSWARLAEPSVTFLAKGDPLARAAAAANLAEATIIAAVAKPKPTHLASHLAVGIAVVNPFAPARAKVTMTRIVSSCRSHNHANGDPGMYPHWAPSGWLPR